MIFSSFSDVGYRHAQPIPRPRRDIPRVLRLGSPDHARDRRLEHNLPLAHLPHERPDNGHKGHPLVPERPPGRRPLGRLRQEALPSDHRVLHLPAHTADDDQHVLVLCHDQYFGGVRGHLQRGVRLRGGRHRREGQVAGVWAG